MVSALRWLAFLWGLASLIVMSYCAYHWFPNAGDPNFDEMRLGFIIGAVGGVPAWLSLPLVAFVKRGLLARWQFYAHFVMPIAAGLLFAWARPLSTGGL